jgi:hypothetical protein
MQEQLVAVVTVVQVVLEFSTTPLVGGAVAQAVAVLVLRLFLVPC